MRSNRIIMDGKILTFNVVTGKLNEFSIQMSINLNTEPGIEENKQSCNH